MNISIQENMWGGRGEKAHHAALHLMVSVIKTLGLFSEFLNRIVSTRYKPIYLYDLYLIIYAIRKQA